MRRAALSAVASLFVFSAFALSQTYTIAPFAGGALPTNIPGTSMSVGGLSTQTGPSIGNITGALGRCAIDSSGNLYFIAYNAVFQLSAASGTVTLVAGNGTVGFSGDSGSATTAQLNSPYAVAVDSAGNVYISDTGNLRIRRVANGIITTLAGNGTQGNGGDGGLPTGAQFTQPAGIAADGSGNVYVADQGANRVRKIGEGVINTVAGGGSALGDNGPATSAQLLQPLGLAVDVAGNLYIDDRQSNRIRKVTGSTGIITTVAGNGTNGFSGDGGQATSAQIQFPTDVAVDAAGDIYIADTGNLRIRKVTTGGVITTIAGTGTAGFTMSGSPTNAQFAQPASIAADSAGVNVYVSDILNNRINKISTGVIAVVVGGGSSIGDGAAAVNAQLGYPSGLATDSGSNLYIADPINQRVRKVAAGVITTLAGGGASLGDGGVPSAAQLLQPAAVAVDATGNVYVADTAASRIRKISGSLITTVAGNGTAEFTGDGGSATSASIGWPVGVAVDGAGNIYIADQFSGRVRQVSAAGTINTIAGGGTSLADGVAANTAEILPASIAVDAAGNLYIADMLNRKVRKVTGGIITSVAGNGSVAFSGDGGAATNAGMNPIGVSVDSIGNLYILDLYNSRVRKVTNGVISTIAGDGMFGFSGDGGVGSSAALDLPLAAAVDVNGNVYVADTGNNRVRTLTGSSTANCTYVTSPSSLQPTIAGGTFPIGLLTGTGCVWSVSGLPSWVTVSGPSSGTGPATVTLLVAANAGVTQSATVSIGTATVSINEAGTAPCTYTLSPTSLQPTSAGGTFPIGIVTGPACTWTITGLPTWISASGSSTGTGSATANLSVTADSGAPRSIVVLIGGVGLPINQADSTGATCVYSLSSGGQAFSASGGNGTIIVTTPSGCTWSASSSASWLTSSSTGSGNGVVNYQAAANTGSARVATISVLGLTYTVEEGAASISGYTSIGAIPDLAIYGGWSSSIALVNPSAGTTQVRINFFDDNGNPLVLPLSFPQTSSSSGPLMASSIDRTLNPGTLLEIATTGPTTQTTVSGWVQILASGTANGFATYRYTLGSLDHQALIPLENRNGTQFIIAFDNTGGFADGLAVTNSAAQTATVGIIIRDDKNNMLYSSTITLPAMGSTPFVLPTSYGFTANIRGTVELDAPAAGQISVLGITYNTATGGFSTIPALIKQ